MKYFGIVLILTLLTACGDEAASSDPSKETHEAMESESAEEYKKEVSSQVNESVVKSLARDWDITQDQARCALSQFRTSQLMRAGSDPEVQKGLKDCGIDPAVAQ